MISHFLRAARPKSFSYVTSTVSATSATNYTFSSVSLGNSVANRVIIVAVISSGGSQSVSSVTIGGNATTLTASAAGATCMAFAVLNNSILTSGDIIVNHSGARTDGCSIAVFNSVNAFNTSATSSSFPSGSASATTLSTAGLTVVNTGYVIGLLAKANSNAITWENVTQIATHTGLNSRNFYFATADITTNNSSYVVKASWTTAASSRIGAGHFV